MSRAILNGTTSDSEVRSDSVVSAPVEKNSALHPAELVLRGTRTEFRALQTATSGRISAFVLAVLRHGL